ALMFVFAIPNLLPLPPGSSTLLGAPLLLLSPQVALGVSAPWLPRAIDGRRIAGADLEKAFGRLLPSVERIERISRPRLTFMFGLVGDRLIGIICSLLSFVLILPIPGGNMLPALTIGVLGFALFQRDGLFALVGYLLAAVSGTVLFLAADLVINGVRHLVNWFGAG
ncbi:MAG: exopolysaccharide biosynthesis protein, partial [Rhizobiales bacterium]|nr:exopolysaccharide biosynthesis protein [Hyphomicrobiales bacterium]